MLIIVSNIKSFSDYSKFVADATGTTSITDQIATVPVIGAIANFTLEVLTDPTSWIAGGLVFDALKAKVSEAVAALPRY